MTDNPKTMTADQIAEQSISKWKHLKFILQDEVVTAMNAFADQARKEGFESGYKKGVEEQFDESEAVTVKARGRKR